MTDSSGSNWQPNQPGGPSDQWTPSGGTPPGGQPAGPPPGPYGGPPTGPYGGPPSGGYPPAGPGGPGYGGPTAGYPMAGGYPSQPGYMQPGGPPQQVFVQQAGNGLAVASMVLGIIAICLFWCPPIAIILALVGLPLGGVGLAKVNRGEAPARTKGQAVAGIVLTIITLALTIGWWIIAANGVFWSA